MNTNTEKLQKDHYNRIARDYAAHYGDQWSQVYRQRFVNAPLFSDLEIDGMKVVDGMCGSGETTSYLLSKGAKVTCIDISEEEIKAVQSN